MSRIGRAPITVPEGVEVKLDGNTITVKGKNGTLTREIHPAMHVAVEGNDHHRISSERREAEPCTAWSVPFPDQQHGYWCNRGLPEGSRG